MDAFEETSYRALKDLAYKLAVDDAHLDSVYRGVQDLRGHDGGDAVEMG